MKKAFIILCAAVMLVAFTAPAMAKTYIGGIVFTDFFWHSQDKELVAALAGNPVVKGQTTQESDNTALNIQLNRITRFKFRWTNEDNVGMFMESSLDDESGSDMGVRHAYGWWDITPTFRIMAGKSTTPFSPLLPSQLMGLDDAAKVIGIGYGEYYSGRFTQVRFQFKYPNNLGFLRIALCDPRYKSSSIFSAKPGATVNNDSSIPRFDVGSPLYFGPVKLYPSFFWQKQTFDDVVSTGDDSITIYGLSLGITAAIGPVMIAAEINSSQNIGLAQGLYSPLAVASQGSISPGLTPTVDSNGSVADTNQLGWWIDLSFKLGPATPHFIYGQMNGDRDAQPGLTSMDWKTYMAGVSVPIALAKGFSIRPELMVYSNGDDNEVGGTRYDLGKETLFGAQFQITF